MDLHGGNIYEFEKEIIDFSANINPLGISENLKKEIIENMDIILNYPDPNYLKLRKKIAKINNTEIENIIIGNGATEIIFLFKKALNPKKTLIISPTFAEYERALKNINSEIEYFELKEKNYFELDLDELKKELKNKYDLLIICNPNNPTGNLIDKKIMEKIYKFCEENNTFLFIDEAFIEFTENGEENTIFSENKNNLFVLRAFTKFFAIPGLRLGYGMTKNKILIKKMNEIKEPWTVNSFAELAGIKLLDDFEYIKKTKEWIKEEKEYFYNELKKIEKIKVYQPNSNFILLNLLNEKSGNLRKKMIDEGILIRDASNFKFLNDSFVRIAIKDREKNDFFIKKLKKVLKND